MGTLAELKARIRLETSKDDIASGGESDAALTTAINQAIENYSDEPFWFNRGSGTVPTVASTATIAKPAAVRIAQSVSYLGALLKKKPIEEIRHLTAAGFPVAWAEDGDLIRLYPIPGGVYSLVVHGIEQIDAPVADGDTNVWTTEAANLINHSAQAYLYRIVWKDRDAAADAESYEAAALAKLSRESRQRARVGLRSTGDEPWVRDLTTDRMLMT